MPPPSRRKPQRAAYLARIKDQAVSTRPRKAKPRRSTAVLTHIDAKGAARMVDVGAKGVTSRRAVARGLLRVSPATRALVRDGATPKGDVLAAARLAGIMAGQDGITIEATVSTSAQTGVEMEALTAVSVAGLTLYDMLKSVERGARLTDIRLVEKTGGKSGIYRAP